MRAPGGTLARARRCRWTRRPCHSSRQARNCASGSTSGGQRARADRHARTERCAMRLLIGIPLLLVMVLFALSNRAPVTLVLWPTDFSLELPLSLAILAAMAIAFLVGGLLVWFSALAQRRRARRAEQEVRLLEAEVQSLKARLPSLPPA